MNACRRILTVSGREFLKSSNLSRIVASNHCLDPYCCTHYRNQRASFSEDSRNKLPKVHHSRTNEDWSENSYHTVADETLESLYNYLDDHVASQLTHSPDFDVNLSQGILTIELPGIGTYVLNKQPANREIWASSPVSGPSRFGFNPSKKLWEYPRMNVTLHRMLNDEFCSLYPEQAKSFDFTKLSYASDSNT